MKTRMVLIAAAMLVFASLSFGQQGFQAFLFDDGTQLKASTIDGCDAGAPLPDGTPIEIRWDQDNNGVFDPTDPLPPLCAAPPECPGGPAGTVNYNTFVMNGEAQGLGAGYFAVDFFFSSVGTISPARFWLVIRCADGTVHYVSQTLNFLPGGQEVDVLQWTCFPCITTPPCIPTPEVTFERFPVPQYACADLCTDHTTIIRICQAGVPFIPTLLPIVTVAPGCLPPTNCNRECPPAQQFTYNPLGWTLNPATGCWENVIIGLTDGCVCITYEGFEAVGYNNDLAAVGMDNSVKLTWSTSSEVGVAHFDIMRSNVKVGEVAATGHATSYNYLDRTAVNGTTYTYALRAVNSDASVTDLGTVEATPSLMNVVVTEYALHQNYPNPFNPTTEIMFDVVQRNFVTLKVYNAAGQEVGTVANGEFDSGRHVVSFNATNLPSGLYFYTVKIGNDFSATKKMLLVK